jgi:chromosome segregation ATPase
MNEFSDRDYWMIKSIRENLQRLVDKIAPDEEPKAQEVSHLDGDELCVISEIEIEQLREENAEFKKLLLQTQATSEERWEIITDLREDNYALKENLAEAWKENGVLGDELTKLKKSMVAGATQLPAYEQNILIQSELKSARKENAELQDELTDAEYRADTLGDALDTTIAERDEAYERVDKAIEYTKRMVKEVNYYPESDRFQKVVDILTQGKQGD